MKLLRRQFLHLVAGTAGLFTLTSTTLALAQDWPRRPITMVVPYAAGGVYDTFGRIYAARLSEILGQQVIIENISGAGGMTGSARVAKAAPDGYQFVFGGISTHAQVPLLYKKPLYDAAIDFTPVALVAETAIVLVARKDLPAGDLAAFIAYAKLNQAKMQYGSPGPGTGSHLACALLNAEVGLDIAHIPYRGMSPAINDLLGGRLDYICPTVSTVLSQIEGKLVQATAVLTRARSATVPNVASAHEQGIKGFDASGWHAIFLPKSAPAPILQKLNEATVAAMNTPSLLVRLKELGATVPPPERRSPDYLQKFVVSEIEKWAKVVKLAGIKPE